MLAQIASLLFVLAGVASLATTFGILRFPDPLLRLQIRARLGVVAVALAVAGVILDIRHGTGELLLAPLLIPVFVLLLTPRVLTAIAAQRRTEEDEET